MSLAACSVRASLGLGLLLSIGAAAEAQDPIPVAFWHHYRAPNAFTPPPMPVWNYPQYCGPYGACGPYGQPEGGVRTPFLTPDQIPHHGRRGHGGHGGGNGPPSLDSVPMHQYVRSPRDFFMFYENLEAERSRELRPQLIP